MTEYFELDNLKPAPLPRLKSTADVRAEHILKQTTKYVGNKYETGLLWKSDNVILGENYSMAMKRLEGVERRMSSDNDLASWYKEKLGNI